MTEPAPISRSIKAVTLYEVIKGCSALVAAFALWIWHQDIPLFIDSANSAWLSHFGSLFSVQVDSITRVAQRAVSNWQLFLAGIIVYALFRFIEAYGLWTDRTWAYWFGLLGYGLFIPAEVYYLMVRPFDWFKLVVLMLNLLVVYVVFKQMRKKGLL